MKTVRNLAIAAALCGVSLMTVGAWTLAFELHAARQIGAMWQQIERAEVGP